MDDANDGEYLGTYRFRNIESLDTEFRYYSMLLRTLVPALTNKSDKDKILPWIHKLHSPEYSVSILRDKRNRYLLMLCLGILNDKVEGVFAEPPAEDVLPDICQLPRTHTSPARWETDTSWDIIHEETAEAKRINPCSTTQVCPVHGTNCPKESEVDASIGETLDKQFRFFLFTAMPYAALLPRATDRNRAACWLQGLGAIYKDACAMSKGIRNDYMMALTGYLSNRQMIGPFKDYPVSYLPPLYQTAHMTAEKRPIIDPTHPKAEQFLIDMPTPEEGVFAFMAISGDLYESPI